MSKRVTIEQMKQIIRGFEQVIARDADKYPRELLTQIRRFIIQTGTIDTTALLVTFDYHEIASPVTHNYALEPNQPYGRKEGFVEFDRDHYFFGTYLKRFTGRRFIQKGIEAANFERISDELVFAAFA